MADWRGLSQPVPDSACVWIDPAARLLTSFR